MAQVSTCPVPKEVIEFEQFRIADPAAAVNDGMALLELAAKNPLVHDTLRQELHEMQVTRPGATVAYLWNALDVQVEVTIYVDDGFHKTCFMQPLSTLEVTGLDVTGQVSIAELNGVYLLQRVPIAVGETRVVLPRHRKAV
jgi:hypothetical protein